MFRIKIYWLTVLFSILFLVNGFGTDNQYIITDINNCFSKGNVAYIKDHLGSNVDLSFDQQKSIYSKSQAISIIKQFIDKESPTYYKLLKFTNPNKSNLIFLISEYNSSDKKYLIYISLENQDDILKITEIHFESR